ncbi:GNAT family N-acetyltransferase [Glycomyces sp. NRRL B-16210]|uniref:GNAT family N-acetyltransferase n=1 Tax=Glycomyces sp. NRRL B-16210 TaxID=1463821 RepID=UPI0004BFF2CC|nr:GNAT family N-acetyltransferase [Glycomyces sp. NRRL B-16210]
MEITELDINDEGIAGGTPAGDALLHQVADLAALVRTVDAPDGPALVKDSFLGELAHPEAGILSRRFVATEDGTVVGYLAIDVMAAENPQLAAAELLVHPDHRGRGHGSALLRFALDHCRSEGRSVLASATIGTWKDGPERPDHGSKFLERNGFELAIVNVRRDCPVDALDPETERRHWDAAAASGFDYEVRGWTGPAPEDLVESLARMEAMVLEEIPLGELDMAPEQVDAAKVRAKEAATAAHRKIGVETVAVHRATGEVVAHTRFDAFADPAAEHCLLKITIVDPAHRGHRLGLLVKLANLRLLREAFPNVKRIWTSNADVNEHMIAINDRLGYRPVDAIRVYQRPIRP